MKLAAKFITNTIDRCLALFIANNLFCKVAQIYSRKKLGKNSLELSVNFVKTKTIVLYFYLRHRKQIFFQKPDFSRSVFRPSNVVI